MSDIGPRCNVCGVVYSDGPACQEFHRSATEEQIATGRASRCPGTVSWRATAEALDAALRTARDGLDYARQHHAPGCGSRESECLCPAARSVVESSLRLTS